MQRSTDVLTHLLLGMIVVVPASQVAAKTPIDYFQPTPIVSPLTSNAWGAQAVLPRDVDNGIEDKTNKTWSYWDGKIIQGPDGKYNLFCSRWPQQNGHSGWKGSSAIHAVSDNILGPYVDKGLLWPINQSGKGHNVTALVMPDGRYAVLVSETRPADVFISSSMDGPWVYQGSMQIDSNGYKVTGLHSNLSFIVRPDGSYLAITRHGFIMLSTTGIMGPYKVQGNSIYPQIPGLNNSNAEDPVIWYSGGKYHVTVNWWDARQARSLISPDGIKNWTDQGLAYAPTSNIVRYTDGTVNHWYKMERPGVVIDKNGHVSHFTFAVVDTVKEVDFGNDNHNSKVIVVPFDGVAFDKDNAGTNAILDGTRGQGSSRTSIVMHHGVYSLEYSASPTGEAEFVLYSTDGNEVARKNAMIMSGEGSLAWAELGALPKGVYFTWAKFNHSAVAGSKFVKF
jgi:hypothetical protein